MADSLIKFGDVFDLNGWLYVYIAYIQDTLYAAKVLPQEETAILQRLENQILKRPSAAKRVEESPLYCFIMLTTEELQERAAHYGNPDCGNVLSGLRPIRQLNSEDTRLLAEEVSGSTSVPNVLRSHVQKLDVI